MVRQMKVNAVTPAGHTELETPVLPETPSVGVVRARVRPPMSPEIRPVAAVAVTPVVRPTPAISGTAGDKVGQIQLPRLAAVARQTRPLRRRGRPPGLRPTSSALRPDAGRDTGPRLRVGRVEIGRLIQGLEKTMAAFRRRPENKVPPAPDVVVPRPAR